MSLWNPEVFSHSSVCHMSGALIVNGFWGQDRTQCCIINIYAPCLLPEKQDLWDRLSLVIDQNPSVCICVIGDFNSIRRESERMGRGLLANKRDIAAFDSFIAGSRLIDLPIHGRNYTCYKPDGSCKSRIDRILVNNTWINKWPNSTQTGLRRTVSDHYPILLEIKARDWGPKPFRYLNLWSTHPDFKEFVSRKWDSYNIDGWGSFIMKEKLKLLKEDLKKWNVEVFGNLENNIEIQRQEIQKYDLIDDIFGLDDHEVSKRNEASAHLLRELKRKDSLQVQKSRLSWLKDGDLNSKLFYNCINKRRKINEVVGIKVNGEWKEEVTEVKKGVFDYFSSHYKSKELSRPSLARDFTNRAVSLEENNMLIAPFSEEEIKDAIWSCDCSKSPGPDGFNMNFFKEFWGILEADLMKVFSDFYQNGSFVKGLNSTFIVLIPKKEATVDMGDFRPISLVGGIYKIISKVLAKRLSLVLPSIISDSQSAFVSGRQIMDNIAVLNEAIDEAKHNRIERIFFKIDFAKAYDTVEWSYLNLILERFNFHPKWRYWMMKCISTASANVLINGSTSGMFNLQRGLRQGDPLSPYLFLIAAEGLDILMTRATSSGMFKAGEIGKDKVLVLHLQFADDTILLGAATTKNAWTSRRVLQNLELLSGF